MHLVGEQVRLAQEQGVFTPPGGTNKIPGLVCADATQLWRAAATRCDVFVWVLAWWPSERGEPRQLGNLVGRGRN